ncbi:MAG TPA: polysaccharide pyruvyl transferase family protein [Candidatus Saccharimonadales bacterium]|jgi:polysaccharide pyruvyl transferase WcaK-like protein|nr:polysaccharide pyruvyl transferase family protein [Candidatus Saccharimonadales bacterium]
MNLPTFLKDHRLDGTLLFGFYGGGNYGDELLMEVLAGLLKKRGTKNVSIAYQHPENYDTFHHDFEYPLVNMHSKPALIKAMLSKKNIVVGGGGLWGMDANLNVLLMSMLLFLSRWVFGKKVYLLAIGYYNSSTTIGRLGAWLAGKAAHVIIARDDETYTNFARINKHTNQDTDIAWYIDDLNLDAYRADVDALDRQVALSDKTLFITLRRFKENYKNRLTEVVADCLDQNSGRPIIIALMEPREVDPDGYALLEQWHASHSNVQILDFSFNPLALFLLFRRHHDRLVFIGPQFHAILSAHLTGVPYLPLAYDNKVQGLLHSIAPGEIPITVQSLQTADVQQFIDRTCPLAV